MVEDHGLSARVVPDLVEIVLTAPYSLWGRRRAPQRGRGEPAEYLGQLPAVVRPPRVLGGAPPGFLGGGGSRMVPVQRRPLAAGSGRVPRSSGPRSNSRAQFGKGAGDLCRRLVRVQLQTQQQGLHPGVGMLCLRRRWRRRCAERRRAWPWLSRAARPPSTRCRGWCRAARAPGRRPGSSAAARSSRFTAASASPRSCAALPAASRWSAARRGSAVDCASAGHSSRR